MNTQQNHWHEEADAPPARRELIKKLPNLLRILGAAAVVVAMYSFLAKGWQSGNDLISYLLMLGHTGALAAVGLASGHWLKEGKSARLLLTLSLVAIPANFAILGAFIYSQTTTVDINHYPHYFAWSVDSLQTALITSGGAILVLVPLVLLGFTVLARSMSKKLSLLFLLSNLSLLLPIRDPHLVALLALALASLSIFFSRRTANLNSSAKTLEGVTALGLQLLPLGVLMGRSLWLYAVDAFLLASLSITLYLILRQLSFYLDQSSTVQPLLEKLSLLPAFSTALWLSSALYEAMILPQALALPLASATAAAMIYDIADRSRFSSTLYRRLAAATLLLGMTINLMLFDGVPASLTCLVTGALLSLHGFKEKQRSVFGVGVILIVIALMQQLYQLVHHFDLSGWATLATVGVVAIVIASVMESNSTNFRLRLGHMKTALQHWQD